MSFSYTGDAKYVPFPLPIIPPQVDPTDDPTISVCFNEDWLPAILTCIKALCVEGSFKDDDPDAIALAVQRGQLLLSQFMQPANQCAASIPSILCISGSFTDLDYGFVPSGTIGCDSEWVSGTGWQSCGPTGDDAKNVAINLTFGSPTFLNSYEFCYTAEPLRVVNWSVDIYFEGDLVHQESGSDTLGGNACHGGSFGVQADRIFFTVVYDDNTVTDPLIITDWSLCYTGDFPLSDAAESFSHTFDFSIDDGGWEAQSHPDFANTGIWQNNRWESQLDVDGSGNQEQILIIGRSFPARRVNEVQIFWHAGQSSNGGFRQMQGFSGGSEISHLVLDSGSGTFAELYEPDATLDNVQAVPTTHSSGGTTQINYITKIVVTGVGSDPF